MSLNTNALTTVDRTAEFIGIAVPASGSAKYNVLERIINSSSQFIERYIGKTVKQTAYSQEEYNTERGNTLNLKNYPVNSSATFVLERRNSGLNENSWEQINSAYFHIDYKTGIIYGAGGLNFAKSIKGYRVTYTAGYDFDNVTTFLGDTEGADLELACWMLVASAFERRSSGGNISSERIGDYSVTFRKAVLENEDLASILDKFGGVDTDLGTVITPYQT